MLCKDVYEKIRNADCTEEELSKLLSETELLENDCADPFKAYYNADDVLKRIDLCKEGKVSDEYLADWANVYAWLLLRDEECDNALTWKDLVEYDITDWLDGLSFYDEEDDEGTLLDDFRRAFEVLDGIYRSLDEWQVHLGYSCANILTALAVNDEKGEFVRLYFAGMDDDVEERLFAKPLSEEKLRELVNDLKKNGYSEVDYWPDNDVIDEVWDDD